MVDRNSIGDPKAPVTLVEFSDYQCPYCKDFWEKTEGQIVDAYVATGKVRFTARSAGNWVSGNMGQGGVESQNSAMAAYCAADQGKFWEMYDALFTNVLGEEAGSFTARRLQAIAENIGLDMQAFNACYSSNKYMNEVNQDFADARAAGINGTPFFVITYTAGGQTQDRHGRRRAGRFLPFSRSWMRPWRRPARNSAGTGIERARTPSAPFLFSRWPALSIRGTSSAK